MTDSTGDINPGTIIQAHGEQYVVSEVQVLLHRFETRLIIVASKAREIDPKPVAITDGVQISNFDDLDCPARRP